MLDISVSYNLSVSVTRCISTKYIANRPILKKDQNLPKECSQLTSKLETKGAGGSSPGGNITNVVLSDSNSSITTTQTYIFC